MAPPHEDEFECTEPVALPQRAAPPPGVPDGVGGLLFDQMVQAASFFDMAGRLITANRAARALTSWMQPGMTWDDDPDFLGLYPPGGGPRIPDADLPLQRALRGEEVPPTEYRLHLRGQPPRVRMISASPIHEDGRQVGVLTMGLDVTAQRLAEDELRASEARLRSLVDNAPAIIIVLDLELRIRFMSRGLRGGSPAAYVGHPATEFLVPCHVPDYEEACTEVLRTGRPVRMELQAYGWEEELRWFDVALAPVTEAGRPTELISVSVDVTARKQAEAERDERQAQLEQAEELAAMGSWSTDARTGRTFWSGGIYRILGYEPGAVQPSLEAFSQRLRPAERAALQHRFDELAAEGGQVAYETEIVRPSGEVRVVRIYWRREQDGQGRKRRSFGIIKDITDRLEVERMKHEFISTVSHELRTPLTAIRAPLTLLRRSWRSLPPANTQEMLEIAVDGVDRMVRLVNDVLDVQRLATGRLSIAPEPVDGRELVRDAARDLAPRAAATGVKLRVRAPTTPLRADPARVNQVLCNLLDNALSFAPRGSMLDVEVRRLGPRVRFRVADRGPGIPLDKLEVVFERFKQLDQGTKRRKGGTGLGLAISRELVGLMGGRIWAERRRGGGTAFVFDLPV